MAGDLRAVVSAIRDRRRTSSGWVRWPGTSRGSRRWAAPLPTEVRDDFAQMGTVAVGLGHKAAEVVRTRNVLLAVELDADDDAMDALHRRMFEVLMDPGWPHGIPAAVDITLLASLLRAVRRPRGDRRPLHRVRRHRPGAGHHPDLIRVRPAGRTGAAGQPKRPET